MKLSIKNLLLMGLALWGLCIFTACSDDDDDFPAPVHEGVVFTLTRKMVYASGVNEIGSVKITLQKGAEKLSLPSLHLRGNEESVSSAPCALAAGAYKLVAYTAYNTRHEYLFDAELDSKNTFEVLPGQVTEYKLPIKTKEILNFNFLRNALMGLCKQVFGDDESTWPWNPKKYPYPDWEGLEFELDDYGSPMYLSGISFEGMKDGKETPWVKMTAIPDGTLSNIAELATINVSDIPNFKQLPSDLDRLPGLQQISCIRTGLEKLPDNFSSLSTLSGLFLMDCQVKDFAYDLSAMKELRVLSLSGNQLETFSTPLGNLPKLLSVDLSHNPLQHIDEACFSGQTVLNHLNLSHTALSALPATLPLEQTLRGLDLSGCHFTEVPAVLNRLPGLKSLLLDGNQLTGVRAADFAGMTDLECLSLADNALGAFPVLGNPKMAWLDLRNCGLKQAPALSAYPELRVLHLGQNPLTGLPENYLGANPKLSVLRLSGSARLATLPVDLGLKAVDANGREAFRLLEVEDCPVLHWTVPAAWRAYDFKHSNDWIFNLEEGVVGNIESEEMDDDFGRVGIKRNGSPHVQIPR